MRNSIIGKLQLLISLAAIVIIAVLAFTPLLNITMESNVVIYENSIDTVIDAALNKELEALEENSDLSDEEMDAQAEQIFDRYKELAYEIAGINEDGEENIDAHISLSPVDIAKSVPDLLKFVQYWGKAIAIDTEYELAREEDGGVPTEVAERCAELREELKDEIDPEAVNINSIRTFRLFFNGFLSSVNLAETDDETVLKLVTVSVLTFLKLSIIFAVLVLFPISMALSLVGLLFGLLSRKRYNKVLKKCKRAIVWIASVLLAVVVCGAELTAAGTLIILAAAAAVVINLLASRVKSYTSHEKRFLNVMQLCAIVSTAGIAIFAIFLAKADLLNFYTSTAISEQLSSVKTDPEEAAIALSILAGMGALTIVVLSRVFKGAIKLVTRAACMGASGGNGFGTAISGALLIVVNNLVMNTYDITLSAEQSDALNAAFVGIIITLASAILFKVLAGIFAHGITREEKRAVMMGTSVGGEDDE